MFYTFEILNRTEVILEIYIEKFTKQLNFKFTIPEDAPLIYSKFKVYGDMILNYEPMIKSVCFTNYLSEKNYTEIPERVVSKLVKIFKAKYEDFNTEKNQKQAKIEFLVQEILEASEEIKLLQTKIDACIQESSELQASLS